MDRGKNETKIAIPMRNCLNNRLGNNIRSMHTATVQLHTRLLGIYHSSVVDQSSSVEHGYIERMDRNNERINMMLRSEKHSDVMHRSSQIS